jgi:hypothetical protein
MSGGTGAPLGCQFGDFLVPGVLGLRRLGVGLLRPLPVSEFGSAP